MLQMNMKQRYEAATEKLQSELGMTNSHALPKLEKIVISMGLGSCLGDKKKIDEAVTQLTQIAGQKAIVTRAKRSVSGFRLREGVDVGCCVTLRRAKMFSFLSRLICLVLPRVRDFRGLKRTAFDGRGNYSFGISEQGVFPEIDPERVTFSQGMNVCIVTTSQTNRGGELLLESFGFPFSRDE